MGKKMDYHPKIDYQTILDSIVFKGFDDYHFRKFVGRLSNFPNGQDAHVCLFCGDGISVMQADSTAAYFHELERYAHENCYDVIRDAYKSKFELARSEFFPLPDPKPDPILY